MIRIGHGCDVHAFSAGDFITIGGVEIAHDSALEAHSDGDVLIHALCDALLGAAGLGDLGKHYPDDQEKYSNISSRELLVDVQKKLSALDYKLVNADITIIAQRPKMAPYLEAMIYNLSTDLLCATDQLNIKATTTEKLGYLGREEGIAVHAVVLIEQ